jgi:carbon-monoxide dehydrogenase small subunit
VDVEARDTLLHVIRNKIGLTGTKEGCGTGECGSCTVLLNGRPVNSCLVLAVDVEGRKITTIEDGELGILQKAFVDHGAVHCGFCTPGMIMSAKGLLDEKPSPSEEEIKRALVGNICRCTGYVQIVEAIKAAASGQVQQK